MKKRVFFSLLPFLILIIYYAIGGYIRFGEGRPEAFVFDEKYGHLLKLLSLILPVYLIAINRKAIKIKSALKAFSAIFAGELLFICGIESGDKHILETYGRDMSILFWYVGWIVILSLLVSIWWLTFAAINGYKGKRDCVLKSLFPGLFIMVVSIPYIFGSEFYDTGIDWLTELVSLMWLAIIVFVKFSAVIYPAYLVILNRKKLDSKKHWLYMAGVIGIYDIMLAIITHSIDNMEWYVELFSICFNEIISFVIAFAVVKWLERRQKEENS